MQMLTAVLLAIMSGLLLVLGYLVSRYQLVDIIAGYDRSKVEDKGGLANMVGWNLMLIGIVGILIVVIGTLLDLADWFWPSFFFVTVLFIFCFRIMVKQKKYETTKPDRTNPIL